MHKSNSANDNPRPGEQLDRTAEISIPPSPTLETHLPRNGAITPPGSSNGDGFRRRSPNTRRDTRRQGRNGDRAAVSTRPPHWPTISI